MGIIVVGRWAVKLLSIPNADGIAGIAGNLKLIWSFSFIIPVASLVLRVYELKSCIDISDINIIADMDIDIVIIEFLQYRLVEYLGNFIIKLF